MNKIAAVVVTYNRKDLLCEAVKALQSSVMPCDILIIDNASTDTTAEAVAPFLCDKGERSVLYRNTGANLGGAGGFSYGVKAAYELGYDYFWLMDDDTIVKPEALSELMKADELLGGNYGWLSSTALWTDGKICNMNYQVAARDWNVDKLLVQKGILRCQMATFVSFLVQRSIVEELGLPIADYFIWGDDTEYSNRIARKHPSYYVSTSEVVHKMKSNENSGTLVEMTDEGRIRRTFYSIRNDMCTFRRDSLKLGFKNWLNVTLLWWKVLFHAKKYKGLKLRIIAKGIWCGFFFAPPIKTVKE